MALLIASPGRMANEFILPTIPWQADAAAAFGRELTSAVSVRNENETITCWTDDGKPIFIMLRAFCLSILKSFILYPEKNPLLKR